MNTRTLRQMLEEVGDVETLLDYVVETTVVPEYNDDIKSIEPVHGVRTNWLYITVGHYFGDES